MQIIFILMLLFSVVVAMLAVQNTTPVTLTFLFFQVPNVPVAVLVLISVAVGAILTVILGLGNWIRQRRALHERNSTIKRLEAELARERAARPSLPGPAPVAEEAAGPESGGAKD